MLFVSGLRNCGSFCFAAGGFSFFTEVAFGAAVVVEPFAFGLFDGTLFSDPDPCGAMDAVTDVGTTGIVDLAEPAWEADPVPAALAPPAAAGFDRRRGILLLSLTSRRVDQM